VDEVEDLYFGVSIWPNPSSGILAIRLNSNLYEKHGKWSVEIVSVLDEVLGAYSASGEEMVLDLSDRSGVFLIYVRQGTRYTVERVVIEP